MTASASPSRSESASALAAGTRLHEFELQQILGIGGFGIVYEAIDHALDRQVAIKEYMPASLAGRTETLRVSLRSASDEESFRLGRESFVKEAKLLARFDHPSLLKVYRYWEDNDTAYMAMPVLRGRTLKAIRAEMQGPAEEGWLRQILTPLLGAIETLHRESVFHRDIAPDNIQIEPDGRPVLMDFGAARRVLSDKTQSLTAILKPAYAPIEQYGEAGAVKQGPWTDLYALGATLHYMLLGRPPAPATARTVDDGERLLTRDNLPGCSEGFLQAIEWMLRPRPADRPQNVAALREVLEGHKAIPVHANVGEMRTQLWERTDVLPGAPARAAPRLDVDVTGLPAPASDLPTQLAPTLPVPGVTEHVWIDPPAAPATTLPAADATIRVPPPATMAAAVPAVGHAPVKPPAARSPLPWVLVGLALAGGAAAMFWPGSEPAPGPAPANPIVEPAAAPVAVQPPPAAPAVEAALPTPAPVASAPAAESAVTTIVVPPVTTPPAPPAAAAKPNPAPAAAADRPARKPDAATPTPTPPTRPARAEPAPAGPGPACGANDGVRYLVCMERECGAAAFANHPACARLRQ